MNKKDARVYRASLITALFVMLLLNVAQTALGQCAAAGINQVIAESNTISLFFDLPVTDKDIALTKVPPITWNIYDATTGTPVPIPPNGVDYERPDPFSQYLSATIHLTAPLPRDHIYYLTVLNLTFNGCAPKNPPHARISIPDPAKPPMIEPFGKSKAKSRTDANIYLSGMIEGVQKGKATTSADIKIDIPFERQILGTQRDIGPIFDAKLSTSEKADANALKMGLKITTPDVVNAKEHPDLTKILTAYPWEVQFAFEADRRFSNINAIVSNSVYAVTPVIGSGRAQLYIQPFIGYEIGRNLKSPVAAAEHRGLSRATAGASLYLNFYPSALFNTISFQSDYIRRWPLRREFSFRESEGKLLPLVFGRSPRDHVLNKLEFDLTDYVGFSISHEYGQLPPTYNKVNNKYSLGLVYKTKLVHAPK